MSHFFTVYLSQIILVLGVLSLLTLFIGLAAVLTTTRLRRRFRKWKDIHSTADLDTVYAHTLEEVVKLKAELALAQGEIAALNQTLLRKVASVPVVRYNAFQEQGNDLSFSLALLDAEKNGVVLTSIYGREESRTYAKPVVGGTSRYTLTEEEIQVIAETSHATTQRHPVHV